ncbi:MAG: crossover junction endodeoxyribonuclease RuvC, partial [Dehalococcoidia bacterium]
MKSSPPSGADAAPAGAGIIVLGVDPGLRITGYGLIRLDGADMTLLGTGVIRPKGETPARLAAIYAGLRELMEVNHVAEMAVEQPFVALNTRSAFAIG